MDNWFWLYLVTRLDAVGGVFTASAIIFGIIGAVGGIFLAVLAGDIDWKKEDEARSFWHAVKWFKRVAGVAIVSVFIAVLVPSRNDAFFIVGGSALLEAAKTDTAKRIGSKSLEAVEAWLDENMPKKEPSK